MLTPQEIQEKSGSFEKAVFGGYSMSSVEDLLIPLQEDYAALYKENAVLKSKMKVLVDRLEEYRAQEESMNRAILTAQKTADELMAETERKCAAMVADSELRLRQRSEDLQKELQKESEEAERSKAAIQQEVMAEREKADILAQLEGKKPLIQRSKGLGENDPEMMWMTTMNPDTRRLIRVMPTQAEATAQVFDLLLGENAQGRKEHIAENGYKYLDLADIS